MEQLLVQLLTCCLLADGQRSQCGEQPHVNWTSVREDGKVGAVKTAVFLARVLCSFGQVEIDGIDILIELYLLSKVISEVKAGIVMKTMEANRGGIAAMNILQMQPGLISNSQQSEMSKAQVENPCQIGQVATSFFAMSFLTAGERHGMLWVAADRLQKLDLTFFELMSSGWPIFGLLARLSEVILLSGQARPVDALCPGDTIVREHLERLRREVFTRLSERRWIPDTLARKVMAAVERLESREQRELGASPGNCESLAQ
eukprot:symbB.v1.2.020125.t1/scaffold1676.1/size106311/2